MSNSFFKSTSYKLGWIAEQKVELELISDVDMYLLSAKGMRGVVPHISKNIRIPLKFEFPHSNHKYLKPYDPKQKSKHIICLDANNFYGNAKFLPTDRFKWIDPKEFDLNKYTKNSLKGFARS